MDIKKLGLVLLNLKIEHFIFGSINWCLHLVLCCQAQRQLYFERVFHANEKMMHRHSIYIWTVGSKLLLCKVENILKGSLDSIPSPSVWNSNYWRESLLVRCKGKTFLTLINKLLKTKSLLTPPSNNLNWIWKWRW